MQYTYSACPLVLKQDCMFVFVVVIHTATKLHCNPGVIGEDVNGTGTEPQGVLHSEENGGEETVTVARG